MKQMLYFGCVRDKGHYLYFGENFRIHSSSVLMEYSGLKSITQRFVECIDGVYLPLIGAQGVYRISQVPPFLIVAWNDRTVDGRPGSNSALLAVGYTAANEIIADAVNHYPSVMNRQTEPLRWEEDIRSAMFKKL